MEAHAAKGQAQAEASSPSVRIAVKTPVVSLVKKRVGMRSGLETPAHPRHTDRFRPSRYHTWPLGIEVPVIDIVLINRREERADGAGETAITPAAAALGNAIFDATGLRLREVPFTPERIQQRLEARG